MDASKRAAGAGDAADTAATPEAVVALAGAIERTAVDKIMGIQRITKETGILAINSAIEAARAGASGVGFKVLAGEIKALAGQVEQLAEAMKGDVVSSLGALRLLGERMSRQVRGDRLVDLSLNAVEIIDRNLYERTCDVRWWATDPAVVEALANPSDATARIASSRLGVILSAYTVYLDLWICDLQGVVVASGRPDRYPRVRGTDVSGAPWFGGALATASGDDFAVADIARERPLGDATTLTYSAAIRSGGDAHGRPLGVLGIHFDWAPQAQAVVDGVRLTAQERARSRVMLVDARRRVIAASSAPGPAPVEAPEAALKGDSGVWIDGEGVLWAHHRTPGYETYRGLGWSGVIAQRP